MNHLIEREGQAFLKMAAFNVLFLLMLIGISSSEIQAQQPVISPATAPSATPVANTATQRMMSCDVVYGGNSSCSAAGICKISPRSAAGQTAMEKKLGCKSTIGLLFPLNDGNGVSLVLTKQLLCPQFYNSHLQQGVLVQESNAELSGEVIQTLGLKINHIRAGNYQIVEEAGQLRIDFNATKQ